MPSSPKFRRRALALGALSLPLVFGAAACSADDMADKVAEKIVESASGEDVDVSFDSESGNFSMEFEDGSSSFSIGSSELPDGWPKEIPLPKDFEVTSSLSTTHDGGAGFNLTGKVSGDVAKAFDEVIERFAKEGWSEGHKSTGNYGGNTNSSAGYDNGTWSVIVTAMSDGQDSLLSYVVAEAQD